MRVGELHVPCHRDARRSVGHVLQLRLQAVPDGAVPGRDRVAVVPRRERPQKLFGAPVKELVLVANVSLLQLCAFFAQAVEGFLVLLRREFLEDHVSLCLCEVFLALLLRGALLLRHLCARFLLPWCDELPNHRRQLIAELLHDLTGLDDHRALLAHDPHRPQLFRAGLCHRRLPPLRVGNLGRVEAEDGVRRLAQHLRGRLVNARAHVFEEVDEIRVGRRVGATLGVPLVFAFRKELQKLLPWRLDARNRPWQCHVVRVDNRRVRLKPEGILLPEEGWDFEFAVGSEIESRIELVGVYADWRRVKVDEARAQRHAPLGAECVLGTEIGIAPEIRMALQRCVQRAVGEGSEINRKAARERVRDASVRFDQMKKVVETGDAKVLVARVVLERHLFRRRGADELHGARVLLDELGAALCVAAVCHAGILEARSVLHDELVHEVRVRVKAVENLRRRWEGGDHFVLEDL